jgi:predicted DNA-binding transcriptional regulator AlpA
VLERKTESLHGQAAGFENALRLTSLAALPIFMRVAKPYKDTTMSAIKLYNTPEAAEILGLSPITLEIWRIQGKGPKFRKIGRLVKYAESDIHAYITSCTRSNTSQTPEQANA